jgi:hypothetical protein
MAKPNSSCKLCKWADFGMSTLTSTTFINRELVNSAYSGCTSCSYILKATALWGPLKESQVLKLEQRAAEQRHHPPLPDRERERRPVLSRKEPGISFFRSGATWSVPAPEDDCQIEIYCPNGTF